MSGIEFRRAMEGEAEEVLRVMGQAFGRVPGSEKYERDRERIEKDIDAHWVLVREGKIVGALHVLSTRFASGSPNRPAFLTNFRIVSQNQCGD